MGTVTVAVPFADRWYFAELLRGATDRIAASGHVARVHVLPPSTTSTEDAATVIERDFAEPDSIGAIAAGFKYRADQSARVLMWRRPVVVVGGTVLGFPTVLIDDIGAARLAVEHLVGLGHSRIAHFAGTLQDQMDFVVHSRRAKGYRISMEAAGLEPVVVENDFDVDEVHRTALRLLQKPSRPTAIFAVSDEMAFPVLAAARELGLRPGEDLSVVGVDDHPRAAPEGLTTVRQQPAEMGAAAADLLLDDLSHGIDPRKSRLHPVSLVVRTSTGRPRGG